MHINRHHSELSDNYLFSRIAQKVNAYKADHPDQRIIRLGIGDVTRPLVPCVIDAMYEAVAEMGNADTFRGYGEEQGYGFLRKAICEYYLTKGVSLPETDVFISDGAKSDLGNILDLFDADNAVLIPNPTYPVYVDTNIMAGRKIIYSNGNADNHFLPMPDESISADIIYLCSPNNPTGAVYTKDQLRAWVDYALECNAIILFDSAYEIFIHDDKLPTSIYQIEGAKRCAIEFCSLSKTAGFTGTRCGYTIVPSELMYQGISINRLWMRRQTTKFNGVPYIIQRGAAAVFTAQGLEQINENIAYYRENARLIAQTLTGMNIWYTGGEHAPYLWLKCPNGMTSWAYFDHLLNTVQIVGTPGAGFGENGEEFFRLSSFGSRQDVIDAMQRLSTM